MSDEETIDVYVQVKAKKEGGAAFLVTEGSVEAWIPYSLLQEGSELDAQSQPGDEGVIIIPVWKAEQEGLV